MRTIRFRNTEGQIHSILMIESLISQVISQLVNKGYEILEAK